MSLPRIVIQEEEHYKCIFEADGVDTDNDLRATLLGTITEFDEKDTFVKASDHLGPTYVNMMLVRSATDEEIKLLAQVGFNPQDFEDQKQRESEES